MPPVPNSIREALENIENDRHTLFRRYNDLRRQMDGSQDEAQHREVSAAYNAYLRACLDEEPQMLHDLMEENTRLRAEVGRWRRGIARDRS